MSQSQFDVVAIGNAIVDIIVQCDDAFLDTHGAEKGHMQLVDADTISKLTDAGGQGVSISGGSAANTVAGLASFGGRAAFIGKVADDAYGDIFTRDIRAAGVTFDTPPVANSAPTARSLVLVTPDGERTMNTFLGISPELNHGEVNAELIAASHILYLEGYLFDRDDAKTAFREAAKIARKTQTKVALTLSDGFCVDRHREEFLALIKTDVDILFANESEITALYQTQAFDEAVRRTQNDIALAALTRSAQGSVILSENQVLTIPAYPVDNVVDSTGAGDLFAAGFLYGLTHNTSLDIAARLGGLAAAEVISQIGARPQTHLKTCAQNAGLI